MKILTRIIQLRLALIYSGSQLISTRILKKKKITIIPKQLNLEKKIKCSFID